MQTKRTGAVVIGASIILFDPIFQGLAISLVAGAIVSTLLTLVVVPLLYYMVENKKWRRIQQAAAGKAETDVAAGAMEEWEIANGRK